VAFDDAFPSAPGHTLVVPRRHVGRLLDLTERESAELWGLARDQLARLESTGPDAYTVGVNDGPAAGQTVAHVHLHLIPRRFGDVTDARGGLRWVLPNSAPYWRT
jgi:diadenosine tetraphosphate (Ap4A) HIT family hydrolase